MENPLKLFHNELKNVKFLGIICDDIKLSKKINLKQHINEKLIAGAIIKADDLVIDGTVVEKLRKLKSQMN